MKFVLIGAAAATTTMMLTSTASLAKAVDLDQVRGSVRTSDINLNTEAGRETFERRLNAQIRRMCTDAGRRDVVSFVERRQCVSSVRVG